MKRVVIFLTVLVFSAANALTLEDALKSAPSRPSAVTAKLELLNAENSLIRVQGDPLALRVERVQAEQAAELKRAQFEQASYSAVLEIAQAYTGVLGADEQLALAQQGLALSNTSLGVANIRVENGSATPLDVQEAQVALNEAEKNAVAARNGLGVARNNLEGMIGQKVEASALEPVPDSFLVTLPALKQVLDAAASHPQLLQARQGLELARVGLETLDPSYASPSQLENAQTQLQTTEELVQESRRGFDLQVRNLYLQAGNAQETYNVAQDGLANAQKRLSFQQDRLESGLLAQIQYDQSVLEFSQTELTTVQARYDYLSALLQLQADTMTQLELPGSAALQNTPQNARTPPVTTVGGNQ